ncbi:anti-CBASS protein Acb1 family protein [Pseudomonas sp. SMN5]|uniref:anti-CBASS protein Acb1 family protein n=1 Tax=Pseudomonas sp. SMN5 TaxID=3390198 RepID=UPI003F841ACB
MTTSKPRIKIKGGQVVTNDSLSNMVANIGTNRDKRTHSQFGFEFVNQFELEAAYQSNWLARRIVDKPNEDALREWRAFSGKQAKDIANEERRLGVQQAYLDTCCWADLYGGAALLMVTGQDLSQPLDLDKIKKGGLKNLVVLDRWDIQPTEFNLTDPLKPNWMLPEFYMMVNGQQKIHYSHIIRRTGARLPRRMRMFEQGWGDSRLRRCMSDLRDVVATKSGIASLVLEANVDTVSVKGLQGALASAQCDKITERYRLFGMMKSIINLGLLDADNEAYERKSIAFSGLSQIMEQFMVWTAGAAEMPVTELWGQSAAGLSSTGEGDLKTYHGTIKGKQDGQMRLDLEALDQVLIRSALGSYPDDIEFEWNPLAQTSGIEQAQEDLADAQADSLHIENGVIRPSHAMRRAQAKGTYAITDEQIATQEQREKDEDNGLGDDEDLDSFDLDAKPTADAALNGFVSVKPDKLSASVIANHVLDAGVGSGVLEGDLHVTLFYARNGIPAGSPSDGMYIANLTDQYEIIGQAPWRALVVKLDSPDLQARFDEIRATGAEHSYPDYLPHLSLKYDPTDDELEALRANPLPLTSIVLGGEKWKPVKS